VGTTQAVPLRRSALSRRSWQLRGRVGSYHLRSPPQVTVPQTITNAQARAALRAAKLLDKVNSLIDSYEDPSAADAWEYSATFDRDSPLLNGLGAMLGLTSEQIDGLFVEAAAIVF
jgi:hypothetical protein